jgi:hypothetical protein
MEIFNNNVYANTLIFHRTQAFYHLMASAYFVILKNGVIFKLLVCSRIQYRFYEMIIWSFDDG